MSESQEKVPKADKFFSCRQLLYCPSCAVLSAEGHRLWSVVQQQPLRTFRVLWILLLIKVAEIQRGRRRRRTQPEFYPTLMFLCFVDAFSHRCCGFYVRSLPLCSQWTDHIKENLSVTLSDGKTTIHQTFSLFFLLLLFLKFALTSWKTAA